MADAPLGTTSRLDSVVLSGRNSPGLNDRDVPRALLGVHLPADDVAVTLAALDVQPKPARQMTPRNPPFHLVADPLEASDLHLNMKCYSSRANYFVLVSDI